MLSFALLIAALVLFAVSRDDDKVGIFDLEAHCKPPCAGRPKTSIPLSSSFPLGALESCDYAKIFGQSELVMAPFRRPFLVSVSIVNFQTSSPLRRYCGHASDGTCVHLYLHLLSSDY